MIFLCPEIWRAARALANLSQRELSISSHVSRNTILSSEMGKPIGLEQTESLRSFYYFVGVEFLGTADLTTNVVSGAGVRFYATPPYPWPIAPAMVPFAVARALLGYGLDRVAKESGLSSPIISRVEAGVGFGSKSALDLSRYYSSRGIEFLRPDGNADTLAGVGARFRPAR